MEPETQPLFDENMNIVDEEEPINQPMFDEDGNIVDDDEEDYYYGDEQEFNEGFDQHPPLIIFGDKDKLREVQNEVQQLTCRGKLCDEESLNYYIQTYLSVNTSFFHDHEADVIFIYLGEMPDHSIYQKPMEGYFFTLEINTDYGFDFMIGEIKPATVTTEEDYEPENLGAEAFEDDDDDDEEIFREPLYLEYKPKPKKRRRKQKARYHNRRRKNRRAAHKKKTNHKVSEEEIQIVEGYLYVYEEEKPIIEEEEELDIYYKVDDEEEPIDEPIDNTDLDIYYQEIEDKEFELYYGESNDEDIDIYYYDEPTPNKPRIKKERTRYHNRRRKNRRAVHKTKGRKISRKNK